MDVVAFRPLAPAAWTHRDLLALAAREIADDIARIESDADKLALLIRLGALLSDLAALPAGAHGRG